MALAACSRRDEYNFLRDQIMKAASFANVIAADSPVLHSGNQSRTAEEPRSRAISNPMATLVAKANTNQGMTWTNKSVFKVARLGLLEVIPIHMPNQTSAAIFAAQFNIATVPVDSAMPCCSAREPPEPGTETVTPPPTITTWLVDMLGLFVLEPAGVAATGVESRWIESCERIMPVPTTPSKSNKGGPNILSSARHWQRTICRAVNGVASSRLEKTTPPRLDEKPYGLRGRPQVKHQQKQARKRVPQKPHRLPRRAQRQIQKSARRQDGQRPQPQRLPSLTANQPEHRLNGQELRS